MKKQTALQLLIVVLCMCALLLMGAAIWHEAACYKKDIRPPAIYLLIAIIGSPLLLGAAAVIWRITCRIPVLVKIFFWATFLLILIPIIFFVLGLFMITQWPV